MPLTSRTFDQLINFTRTSAATFVGSNGLIQTTPQSVNLLTYTQEFDNAVWVKNVGATVAANVAVAPDGTNTADRISFTNDELSRVQQATTSALAAHTYTIWLRSESGSVTVRFGESGVLTAVTVTETWQRFTVVVTGANPNVTIRNEVAAGIKSVLAWGAQVEVGSVATTYTRNFGGLFPPRFDYNPVTLAPRGLLIEEQRTNLFTYSADFTNAAWGKVNITATGDAATAPDGTTTADKLEVTATGAGTVGSRSITSVTGTTAAYSIYVKQGTGATVANGFALRNSTTSTNLISGTLNYTTGVWTYTTGSTGVTVQDAGNGWWRLTLAASSGITSGDTLTVYYGYVGGTSVTAGDHFFIWGAQLEVGPFASSYIPTVASQVTRSADFAVISSPNFLPWYNQTEGTLLVEADSVVPGTAGLYRSAALSDGTLNNLIQMFVFIGTWGVTGTTAGVTQFDLQPAASYTRDTPAKFGLAFRANDFAASVNGSTPLTDSSGTAATMSQFNIGSLPSYGQINGHVRRVTFYPSRLTNTQLQALTT